MSKFSDAGSHIPILIKAMEYATKKGNNILELGMGWNSTPLLHWICKDQELELMSVETDRAWAEKFSDYTSEKHRIVVHERDMFIDYTPTYWGLVLIDGRPAKDRHKYAIQLANSADIVIIHDSEPEINRFYRYDRVYPHFKYRFDYRKVKPYTTVLSNVIDVGKAFE